MENRSTAALLELYCKVRDAETAKRVQVAICVSIRGLPRYAHKIHADTIAQKLGIEQPIERNIFAFARSNANSRNEAGEVRCIGEYSYKEVEVGR